MAAISKTDVQAVLKELYSGQAVQNLSFDAKSRPFLSMIRKNTNFGGKNMPLPVIWGNGGGRSASISKAISNVSSWNTDVFAIDIVKNYKVAQIENETLRRGATDKGSFVRIISQTVDTAIEDLSDDLAAGMYRTASGSVSTIGATTVTSTTTLVLGAAGDHVNFNKGDKVVFAASTSAALRSATALTVNGVDRSANTLTLSATPDSLSASIAVGDQVFHEGDYASASDVLKLSGLPTWLDSTGAALFGVTRTTDKTRLAGVHLTGDASSIEESIIDGAAELGRQTKSRPDVALVSFGTFRDLVKDLGSKVQRDAGGKGVAGYESLAVYGPRGIIEVVADTFCPDNVVYLITKESWELVSMGDAVELERGDGLDMRLVYNNDAWEIRVVSFAQLACNAPGRNARIVLS